MKLYNNIFILFIFILSFTLSHAQVSGEVNCTSTTYIKTDFCVCLSDQTAQYLKNNKLTSLDNLLNTARINFLANTKSTCLLAAQQKANSAAQAAQAAQAVAARQQQQNNGSNDSGSSAAGLQQAAGQLNKIAPLLAAGNNGNTAGGAATAATNNGSSTATQASGTGLTGSSSTTATTSDATTQQSSNGFDKKINTSDSDLSKPASGVSPDASLQPTANNTVDSGTGSEGDLNGAISTGKVAETEMPGAGQTVNQTLGSPSVGEAVKTVNSDANGGGKVAPSTEDGIAAKEKDDQLKTKTDETKSDTQRLTQDQGAPAFDSTSKVAQQIKQKIDTYVSTTKPSCTKSQGTASFLCIETTSPGVNAVKTLMDVAGPALAIIGSAQKACSSTADVTKFASMGLMAAKGACVAAKLYCDSTCKSATTEVTSMLSMVSGQLNTAINTDDKAASGDCKQKDLDAETNSSLLPQATRCHTDLTQKKIAADKIKTTFKTALENENNQATMGTSPSLALKCQMNTKDIALLGIQAAGMLASSMGSKKCAEKLASSGSSGISTAQYCDKSENVSTQFCKCQKNNAAEGCPGALATTTSATTSDQAGANIKSLAGNSGFASGYTPTGVSTGVGGVTTGGLGSGSTGLDASTMAATGSGDGAKSGSGAGDSSTGGGVSAPAGSTGTILKAINDAKKWGFDSLGFGGGSGGGSSGGSANKGGSNGALSQKQAAAISRQIASEKLAAEVSSASGKSNWEKVRQRYLMQNSSFLNGQ